MVNTLSAPSPPLQFEIGRHQAYIFPYEHLIVHIYNPARAPPLCRLCAGHVRHGFHWKNRRAFLQGDTGLSIATEWLKLDLKADIFHGSKHSCRDNEVERRWQFVWGEFLASHYSAPFVED